jgi:hypothetical protein
MRPLMPLDRPCRRSMVVLSLSETNLFGAAEVSNHGGFELAAGLFRDDLAPVRMAISCSMALRRSPKPGALMASTLSIPRSLFSTRVASASPSTSSAMMTRSRLPIWTSFSSRGRYPGQRRSSCRGSGCRALDHGFHVLGIGDEVGRNVTAVELHTFDIFGLEFEAAWILQR